MIETESYIQVDADTQITYKVEPVDGYAVITIGPTTGPGSSIHLLVDDPDLFRAFAETLIAARNDYVRDVLERRQSAPDDRPLTVVR